MDESSIGEEIAAEIQVSVNQDGTEFRDRLEDLESIVSALRDHEFALNTSDPDSNLTVTAITTHNRTRPAFSGLIYGVVAVAVTIDVSEKTITGVNTDSRTSLDVVDFGDGYRQARWAERKQAIKLVEASLGRDPELIIVDNSLVLTRDELLTHEESSAASAWDDLLETLNTFWERNHERLQPWNPDGPVILGLSNLRGYLILTALRNGEPGDFAENLSSDLFDLIDTEFDRIKQIGANRVIARVLCQGERSPCYPFKESNVDYRWEPATLRDLGLQGVFFSPETNEHIHLEFPGVATQWNTESVSIIIHQLSQLFWISETAEPVPIWYTRKKCKFPESMLNLYYKELADRVGDIND